MNILEKFVPEAVLNNGTEPKETQPENILEKFIQEAADKADKLENWRQL